MSRKGEIIELFNGMTLTSQKELLEHLQAMIEAEEVDREREQEQN